jgi:alanine racemase
MRSLQESMIPHPAWIEIDLGQFKKNIRAVRRLIGESLFCLCVKADAYGHGLSEAGRAAQEEGVDYLAVSCLKEGVALRLAGISIPILVLGAIHEDQIQGFIEWNLEFTISSKYKADLVVDLCTRIGKSCRVHLEVDTGMRRTGVRPETARELLPWMMDQKAFHVVGVYSHFATGDLPNHPFAREQIRQFRLLRDHFGKGLIWHLANSGGVALYPDSHFDMVRPGLLCYGYFPDGTVDPAGEIAPCFSLKAKVSYFKVVEANEGISYGHTYKTAKKTRVVTVPLGYGDGYLRSFSNKGVVLIRNRKYKISGVVCMDQFMVDIGNDEVYIGDEVTLIGNQGIQRISLEEASFIAESVPYELLCSLKGRLSRIYL